MTRIVSFVHCSNIVFISIPCNSWNFLSSYPILNLTVLGGTLSRLGTISSFHIIQLVVVEFQKLEQKWHRQLCKNSFSKMRYEKNWNPVPSFQLGKKSSSSWSEQNDVLFQPKITLETIYLSNARLFSHGPWVFFDCQVPETDKH